MLIQISSSFESLPLFMDEKALWKRLLSNSAIYQITLDYNN